MEEQKQTLRRRLLAARSSVADRSGAAAAVCRRLAVLPDLVASHVVAAYAAHGSEVDIDDALRALLSDGTIVCLPWVEGDRLGLGAVKDLDRDLAPGWQDVREPRPPRDPVRPHAVDAVIVPGVGFDPLGHRLGYGGGHFDRLLAKLRRGVPVIGVAFDEQVVTQLPVAGHDLPVDVVVTPNRTLRAPRL